MKKHLLTLVALFLCSFCISQITYTNPRNGLYHYNSQLQQSNLHFYLFGDGHHSFDNSPSHNFDAHSNPSVVTAYTSNPYENDPPELLNINVVNNGTGIPTSPAYGDYTKKVQLIESWNLVNSRENYYILMFQNNESPNRDLSGCIEFHYKLDDSYVESVNIKDNYINNNWVNNKQHLPSNYQANYTHKFTWEFSDLEYGEKRFIYIPTDCIAPALAFVNTRAVMKVDDCSRILTEPRFDGSTPGVDDSPIYTLTLRVVNNPHDPNAIVTDPGCLSFPYKIQTIRHRIYFQNDGVDPVENVVIKFTNDVPIHNIQIVEASDQCTLSWTPEGDYTIVEPIIITFGGILLPGLQNPSVEYEETIGWIDFDLCYNEESFDFMQTDCANTAAHIFFDTLAPVIAYNTICRQSNIGSILDAAQYSCTQTLYSCPQGIYPEQDFGIQNKITAKDEIENVELQDISAFPNPATNTIQLANLDLNVKANIKIRNVKGQLIQSSSTDLLKNKGAIDVSELENGVYYISITTSETVKTMPFVKL